MFIEIEDPAGVTHLLNSDEIKKVVRLEGELPMVVTGREKIMVKTPSYEGLRAVLMGSGAYSMTDQLGRA